MALAITVIAELSRGAPWEFGCEKNRKNGPSIRPPVLVSERKMSHLLLDIHVTDVKIEYPLISSITWLYHTVRCTTPIFKFSVEQIFVFNWSQAQAHFSQEEFNLATITVFSHLALELAPLFRGMQEQSIYMFPLYAFLSEDKICPLECILHCLWYLERWLPFLSNNTLPENWQ